ncbi:MAG: hypothetical protein ACOX6U_03035 [Oscillospiraceae bacterium]
MVLSKRMRLAGRNGKPLWRLLFGTVRQKGKARRRVCTSPAGGTNYGTRAVLDSMQRTRGVADFAACGGMLPGQGKTILPAGGRMVLEVKLVKAP